MKIKYTVIFTTDNKKFTDDSIKSVSFYSKKRKDKSWVRNQAYKQATMKNMIDSYSLRNNYWVPALCDVRLSNVPWNGVYELSNKLSDDYGAKIRNTSSNKYHSTIQCEFEDMKESTKVKNQLISKYGKVLPVGTKDRYLEISLKDRVELDIEDAEEIKKILEIYNTN